MAISETILVLLINNSFLLAGAIAKYIADSECIKLVCCGSALKVDKLRHLNSHLKEEADQAIDTLTSTVTRPIIMAKVDGLRHLNTHLKEEANQPIDTLTPTVTRPVTIIESKKQ